MLVFAVNMIATKQPASSLWGIPLTLFGTLCWAGPITGGHMNPAVSLAVLIQHIDKFTENIILFFVMVIAQFIGGMLGLGFFISVVHGKDYLTTAGNIAQLSPQSNGIWTVTSSWSIPSRAHLHLHVYLDDYAAQEWQTPIDSHH